MAKILVFNNDANRMETYILAENSPMPYNVGNTLSVREFRGSSRANTMWTDRNTMLAWNQFRAFYGRVIPVGYAFKRIWEGGHGKQSQHYAGTAFDVGQSLSSAQRESLRQAAVNWGNWSYVEPASLAPTWVHIDKRFGVPACAVGYPLLRLGSRGNYVLTLQDGLNALGFITGPPDGIFGTGTATQVRDFQRANQLQSDSIVGCNTWTVLTDKVVGIGRTTTVINA